MKKPTTQLKFEIINMGDKGLLIELGGKEVCDFYPDKYERRLVTDIIYAIGKIAKIPVKRTRDMRWSPKNKAAFREQLKNQEKPA